MEIRFYSSRDRKRFYATYTSTRYLMIEKSNPIPRIRNIWPPLEEDEEPVYEKSMEIEDMEPERLEESLRYFVEHYLLDILEEHEGKEREKALEAGEGTAEGAGEAVEAVAESETERES